MRWQESCRLTRSRPASGSTSLEWSLSLSSPIRRLGTSTKVRRLEVAGWMPFAAAGRGDEARGGARRSLAGVVLIPRERFSLRAPPPSPRSSAKRSRLRRFHVRHREVGRRATQDQRTHRELQSAASRMQIGPAVTQRDHVRAGRELDLPQRRVHARPVELMPRAHGLLQRAGLDVDRHRNGVHRRITACPLGRSWPIGACSSARTSADPQRLRGAPRRAVATCGLRPRPRMLCKRRLTAARCGTSTSASSASAPSASSSG